MDISRIIAAISPETYCSPASQREVRRLLDEGLRIKDPRAVVRASQGAEPREPQGMDLSLWPRASIFACLGLDHPLERHTLVYDCLDDSLEALYFDLLHSLERSDFKVAKLVDTFTGGPGSGSADDMLQRGIRVQREIIHLTRGVQDLVADILRRAERLKAQKFLLDQTTPHGTAEANQRLRFDIERKQLQAQIDLLKLHARWLQPYLGADKNLNKQWKPQADIVTGFNTAVFELALLAHRELAVKEIVDEGELPEWFARIPTRRFATAILVELRLRSAPLNVSRGTFAHRGRAEVRFTSYGLHDAEIGVLGDQVQGLGETEALSGLRSPDGRALFEILADVEALLADPRPTGTGQRSEDVNPFSVLLSLFLDLFRWLRGGKARGSRADSLEPDNQSERVLRSEAILTAREECLHQYESLKTRLGGPSMSI